jgi:hypothetical protein
MILTNLSEANLKSADLNDAELLMTNLSGADLTEANLTNANLTNSNLESTKFNKALLNDANLRETILIGADLTETHLRGANLSGADLSKAIVDELTLRRTDNKIIGAALGVNGIWSKHKDSAALMTLIPPGNSMQGSNYSAVIESLLRARRLHGYSLTLTGIILLIAILKLSQIEFPWAKDVQITPDRFVLLAILMSIGILSLVVAFMSDALKNARYLQDRESVASVGSFPWILSRYSVDHKTLSVITRVIFCYHTVVYMIFLTRWEVFDLLSSNRISNIMASALLSALLLIFSSWTFKISQQFQKPILFDKKTEQEHETDIEKLTNALNIQTEILERFLQELEAEEIDKSSAK